MINKIYDSVEAAVAGIHDGATILIGGFGLAGMPAELIDALIAQGARDLTIVNNNAGNGDTGLAALLKAKRVRKIICSFPRQSDSYVFDALFHAGEIELELVPQGNLAERIRAAGAGIGGFFTRTAYGTPLAEGKKPASSTARAMCSKPIHADFALIKADAADRWGNPVYRKTRATSARSWPWPPSAPSRRSTGWWNSASWIPSTSSRRACSSSASSRWTAVRPAFPDQSESERRTDMQRLTRDQMAARVAGDIPDGAVVNLGIGLPTGRQPPAGRPRDPAAQRKRPARHGPAPAEDQIDGDLINAGQAAGHGQTGRLVFPPRGFFRDDARRPPRLLRAGRLPGVREGRPGQLAYRRPRAIPAVGGAMDWRIGAKQVFVMMEHQTKKGESKIVPQCTYPLTGIGCVTRIYTDLATIDVTRTDWSRATGRRAVLRRTAAPDRRAPDAGRRLSGGASAYTTTERETR